ncbi:MAG: hypothetical protein ACI9RO_000155 [Alteromonas macleodii]|jgi:hypothetical protein
MPKMRFSIYTYLDLEPSSTDVPSSQSTKLLIGWSKAETLSILLLSLQNLVAVELNVTIGDICIIFRIFATLISRSDKGQHILVYAVDLAVFVRDAQPRGNESFAMDQLIQVKLAGSV